MKNRWHDSILDAATSGENALPWTRGAARKAMIQRRKAAAENEHDSGACQAKSA